MNSRECLVELDEVLNYLDEEEFQKLPSQLIESIKENKDKQYSWKYDESKNLDEQNLDRKTIAMLSYLNMKYFCNEEQRKLLEEIHKFNEVQKEEQKRIQYNPENLFKDIDNSNYVKPEMSLQKVEETKWYEKIFLFIKNIFKR